MKNPKKTLLTLLLAVFFIPVVVYAQRMERDPENGTPTGWYAGFQGGMPLGVSTFSSFGADKTRAGFAAGLYSGYRFTPAFSLEFQMKWGKTNLSAQQCCLDQGYWLGVDGIRYNAPVLEMEGWDYADLKSSVFIQHYGLQFNVNLLGFFARTKRSRWTLELSPVLAAVGTKATLKTLSSDAEVPEGVTEWHLGAGGNLQAGYRITDHLGISVYSGITYLTGSRMDGMPKNLHRNNYIWESGIRLGWTFGKCRKSTRQPVIPAPVSVTSMEPKEPKAEKTVCPEEPEVTHSKSIETISPGQPENSGKAETMTTDTRERLVFPTVYFAFNGTEIPVGETEKMQTILSLLRKYPEIEVTVTGWCDSRGSKTVNKRISLQRAGAVKTWLVNKGVPAGRITTVGKGSDTQQTDAAKARRAETNEQQIKR